MAAGPSTLLTCDVKGLSKSCALHKLRWKNVDSGSKEAVAAKAAQSSQQGQHEPTEGEARQWTACEEEHLERQDASLAPDSIDEVENLVLSLEPSGELRAGAVDDLVLESEDSGLFNQRPSRLMRVKSDESAETARSKDESPSVGVEAYGAMVASGPRFNVAKPGGGMGSLLMRRNSSSASSTGEAGGGWGFYEDCDSFFSRESASRLDVSYEVDRVTPEYVLEDSLASQALWHSTAGKRPPQPIAERKKFEALWAKNFEESNVDYSALDERNASECHRPAWARVVSTDAPHVIPLLREQSPFGTSATKSWECPTCGELSSMMVHIPKYQVVKEGSFDIHAEYLVVVRLRFVTFGLWRRYSHFQRLADKIIRENQPIDFENTLGSWRCVKRRQKWFRCLDKDYITLKCFLLERFLHDAVFESTTSELFLDFLEIQIPDHQDDDYQTPATSRDTAE